MNEMNAMSEAKPMSVLNYILNLLLPTREHKQ